MISKGANGPASAPQLHWFATLPDWKGRLGRIEAPNGEAWGELVALANSNIDLFDTIALDRKMTRLFRDVRPPQLASEPVRLALLSSATSDHLQSSIRVGALRRGFWLDLYAAPYGQYSRSLVDKASLLHQHKPDTVLFSLDARHVLGRIDQSRNADYIATELDRVCNDIVCNWKLAQDSFGCHIIQQTLLPVFPEIAGSNEHRIPGALAWLVQVFNQKLRDLADSEQVDLLALDLRAAQDGLSAWYDPALWFRAKQEIHPLATPVYGDLVGRIIAARRGRSSKCLVLDLDNTLWGGVIGDDGLNGIVLGQGSARGEAYSAFQSYVRSISRRGVILAVCSKNDRANALQPFENHPDMTLSRSDIAWFVANWEDKPSNIRAIANHLNIGLDSLVFVDDNPFERQIVRQTLPMVQVPELPDDPALYPSCLADAGYFEAVAITSEDLTRTIQYKANLERNHLASSSTDLTGYLRSLAMELYWGHFDAINLKRIVQLINKTNQFNLTTQRCTEADATKAMESQESLALYFRLTDRFGDNGIIAVVTGQLDKNTRNLTINNWLMSCRVLGRQVEQGTLNVIIAEGLKLGARRLIGEFIPSEKNGLVRDHYQNLGFTKVDEMSDGSTFWALDIVETSPNETYAKIIAA